MPVKPDSAAVSDQLSYRKDRNSLAYSEYKHQHWQQDCCPAEASYSGQCRGNECHNGEGEEANRFGHPYLPTGEQKRTLYRALRTTTNTPSGNFSPVNSTTPSRTNPRSSLISSGFTGGLA